MNDVSFKKGLSTKLPATRSDDTLYFVSDKGQLYIGEHNIGENLNDLTVQNVITAKGLSYKDAAGGTLTSLTEVGLTVDPSNVVGGWDRNLISVKSYENDDTEGNPSTIRVLGAYGGAHINGKSKLISIYMGGSYNDPWLKMDISTEEFTFKNTPKVGTKTLATTDQVVVTSGTGVNSINTSGNSASGADSVAFGLKTVASEQAQTVIGKYNADDKDALFIVGVGSSDARKNAFTVTADATDPTIKLGETGLSETQLQDLLQGSSNIVDGLGTNSLMQKEDAGKYTDAKPNFV